MFGISYVSWQNICDMYFNLSLGTKKAYLQWFPFSKISEEDEKVIRSEEFFNQYIKSGCFSLFPEVMRHSENFIQKSDGSFRSSKLVSPIIYLILQSIGKEISMHYQSQRPTDISVYYAGNYEFNRPKYTNDYDDFFKEINSGAERFQYFIKTDVTNFFGNINVNELIERINDICNKNITLFSQTNLLLIKELLLYCGDGYYPLIENSIALSYLATVIYLDSVDCELYEFIDTHIDDILDFQMIRYVDDLYILFSSEKPLEQLTKSYNSIRNEYSSILKRHSLSLNTKKCSINHISEINEALKKSQYDETINGVEFEIGELYSGSVKNFLGELFDNICNCGITNDEYTQLVQKHFSFDDIEYTADEVFNYLVYENQSEIKQSDVSKLLVEIINKDISFISIDPKRLTVMVLQSGNDNAVKALLNQLFKRHRAGLWNSYDTTISIAYLIQSKFQHIDLLSKIKRYNPDLYLYYYYSCRTSFLSQLNDEKWQQMLRCINKDLKSTILYYLSVCENNKSNYLGAFAFYKSFFDRISANMAFISGIDSEYKKVNYKGYYSEGSLKKLYHEVEHYEEIIGKAHKLRNQNPLNHSSAGLIDKDSTSKDLKDVHDELEALIFEFAKIHNL